MRNEPAPDVMPNARKIVLISASDYRECETPSPGALRAPTSPP
jgi:hypothetical protein